MQVLACALEQTLRMRISQEYNIYPQTVVQEKPRTKASNNNLPETDSRDDGVSFVAVYKARLGMEPHTYIYIYIYVYVYTYTYTHM